MAIYDGSRYNNQPVYNVRRDASGRREPAIYHQGYFERKFTYVEYQVQELERVDHLAYRFLGDSQLWWVLAASNPEIFYPVIEPGTIIRIPQVEGAVTR